MHVLGGRVHVWGVGVYVCKSRGRMCVGDRGCMCAWVGMGACVGG